MATPQEIAASNAWYEANIGNLQGTTRIGASGQSYDVSQPAGMQRFLQQQRDQFAGYSAIEREDAAREAAKRAAAFSVPRDDTALSPRAQAIVDAYNRQHGYAVDSEGAYRQGAMPLYDPSEEAGGPVYTGRAAAYKEAWTPLQRSRYDYGALPERTETVPEHRAGEMVTQEGRTFFVPFGERTQQEIREAKAVIDVTSGRIGLYQVPRSIYEGAGFRRVYGIETASGSTGALQSGMFSTIPLTADVRTQWAPGNYAASADVIGAAMIRRAPSQYSRLGAEAYGGVVQRLDNRTLEPGQEMGRYPVTSGNLANLVDPYGPNLPKSELTSREPWRIDYANMPAISTMNKEGKIAPLPGTDYAKIGYVVYGRAAGQLITEGWNMFNEGAVQQARQERALPLGSTGLYVTGIEKMTGPGGMPEQVETVRPAPSPFYMALSFPLGAIGAAAAGADYIRRSSPEAQQEANKTAGTVWGANVTTISGGNETITAKRAFLQNESAFLNQESKAIEAMKKGNVSAAGNWTGSYADYQAMMSRIGEYNQRNDRFNRETAAYNEMDRQNPTMITTSRTGTTITSTPGTLSEGDMFRGWLQSAGQMWEASPVRGMLGGVFGTVAYGTAGAGAYGAAAGEAGFLMPVLESNPIGWGIGIGAGAVMLFERSGRLGLTGETTEPSIRSFGAWTGQQAYRAGYQFAEDFVKPVYFGAQTFKAQAPRMAAAAMSAGSGMFRGSELPARRTQISEIPAALPSYSEAPGHKYAGELPAQRRSMIEINEHPGQTAPEYYRGNRATEQNLWRDVFGVSYPKPTKEITERPTAYGEGFPVSNPQENRFPEATRIWFDQPFLPRTEWSTEPRYDTVDEVVQRPSPPGGPKIEFPGLPGLPWFGGGGSTGGGGGRSGGRTGHREVIPLRSFLWSPRASPRPVSRQKASKAPARPMVSVPRLPVFAAPRAAPARRPAMKRAPRKRKMRFW